MPGPAHLKKKRGEGDEKKEERVRQSGRQVAARGWRVAGYGTGRGERMSESEEQGRALRPVRDEAQKLPCDTYFSDCIAPNPSPGRPPALGMHA